MTRLGIDELREKARTVRKSVLQMIYQAGTGHPAGSLSAVEILTALYFGLLRHDPRNPDWAGRDRLFLSAGHICPAQYAVMAEAGYFGRELLSTYARLGSPLQGHPERLKLPGVEITSGSLGMGLAQAVGFALAKRIDGEQKIYVHCLCSDAEHQEGNHWEAVLLASQHKLSRLILWVDRNGIQIEKETRAVAPLDPLADKYRAFGWNAVEVDGHDFVEIGSAVDRARACTDSPTVIVARTLAGKGVSFMEGNPAWHARVPNEEEYRKAMRELEKGRGKDK